MEIGSLDRRITLQSPVRTSDGMGGSTIVWYDQAKVWAKIWSVSSNEKTEDNQVGLERIWKVAIRSRSTLKSSWRVKWDSKYGTRYFAIATIDPDQKDEFTYLICKEVA